MQAEPAADSRNLLSYFLHGIHAARSALQERLRERAIYNCFDEVHKQLLKYDRVSCDEQFKPDLPDLVGLQGPYKDAVAQPMSLDAIGYVYFFNAPEPCSWSCSI